MKDAVEVKELKEKYPEQTKWIAQELYKANSQEDYKNLYNYFYAKCDEDNPYGEYKISGPDASLCYYYTDTRTKKLIGEIKGNKIFTFYQNSWGDGDILDNIEEWLDKYHEKDARFSEEQINEWIKYADVYRSFFVDLYKKINMQPSKRMLQVFDAFKQALKMPMSKAEKFFNEKSKNDKYPLFDYGFKFIEGIEPINLCYNWAVRPMLKYDGGWRNMDYYEFDEKSFNKFKKFFESQLEYKKIGGFKSEETLRREKIRANIMAKAGLKEEAFSLSGDKKINNLREEILKVSKF